MKTYFRCCVEGCEGRGQARRNTDDSEGISGAERVKRMIERELSKRTLTQEETNPREEGEGTEQFVARQGQRSLQCSRAQNQEEQSNEHSPN